MAAVPSNFPPRPTRRTPPPPTSKMLAEESLANDESRWVIYDPGTARSSFDKWLHGNKPSQISRSDGVGWICVVSPQFSLDVGRRKKGETRRQNVKGLLAAWEDHQESGRPVNQTTITQLARAHGVTCGKWLLYLCGDLKVDYIWSLLARGCAEGRCGTSVKVNPNDDSPAHQQLHRTSYYGEPSHVICVYNDDFTDQESVYDLETKIRALGVKSRLSYKPDAYTYLGIYRNNPWGLRPTIYTSHYDILKGTSIISAVNSILDVDSSLTMENDVSAEYMEGVGCGGFAVQDYLPPDIPDDDIQSMVH